MKLTFRWYGEKDCIPLEYIKQIQGMSGVVTAVYDVPVGEVWSVSALQRLKTLANGAGRFNDLPKMAAKYAKRIYFAHLRQLKFVNETDFYENGHQTSEGNVDIYAIVKALVENGFDGYLRPDHGRNIWGEDAKPGYGLYDRALGAAYLQGVFEAIEKSVKHSS